MSFVCRDAEVFVADDLHLNRNEQRTFWVVVLTAVMMGVEIIAGYMTGSMALLADGYHMASHAGALTIAFFAYRFAKSKKLASRFSFGAGKIIPLGGYTSAIVLAFIAILMGVESFQRFFRPQSIQFNEAIWIASLGLLVNIVSAVILGEGHTHTHDPHEHSGHDQGHSHVHDHNLRSAYLHVVADALTSVTAIVALLFGKYFHWVWMDAAMGLVGSLVILRWAFHLCKDAGLELLDAHSGLVDPKKLTGLLREHGAELLDLHIWRIAPKAIACEVVLKSQKTRGVEYYRKLIQSHFPVNHLVVEERIS